jgi:hypothetical protein
MAGRVPPSRLLAPQIFQLRDSRIDQLKGRFFAFSFLRVLSSLHGCFRFFMAVFAFSWLLSLSRNMGIARTGSTQVTL